MVSFYHLLYPFCASDLCEEEDCRLSLFIVSRGYSLSGDTSGVTIEEIDEEPGIGG